MNIPPLHYLNKIGAADVFRYDSGSKKIVEVLKHNRSKPGFTNRKQLIGSNLTFGKLLVGRPEQPILIWIFRLMEVYFNLTVNLRDYDRVVDIYDALDRGEIDLGMIVEPILNTTLNRIVILKMDQHLYLPMNHTHHSDTFFIDIFAHDLRYAIVSLVMLIILLNAILTRKHSPIRHLLFVYELLSGTRAYPNPTEYVPNRALQLLVGIVLQILSSALATFLVAQLSIPIRIFPVTSFKDLAQNPQYKVCIPMLRNLVRHIPAIVKGSRDVERLDLNCQHLMRMKDPEKLAEYLCKRENTVVVLSSDAVMNTIFYDEKLLERMCDIVPIEKKIIINWLSLPYSAKFPHVELLKQFIIQARTAGLLQKPYRHLIGSWNRHNRHKKNRWADIELASLKVLFMGYGAVGCCSLIILGVEILIACISKVIKHCRKQKRNKRDNRTLGY